MRASIVLIAIASVVALAAQSAPTRVAAVPTEKGGQDIFGAYDVVQGAPAARAARSGAAVSTSHPNTFVAGRFARIAAAIPELKPPPPYGTVITFSSLGSSPAPPVKARIVEPSLDSRVPTMLCDFLPTTRSRPVAGSTVTA